MLNRLLTFLGLRKDIGAPVHVGANPVYATYVYQRPGGVLDDWVFSWHTSDHKRGLIRTFFTQEDAETARDHFEQVKVQREHALFIRPCEEKPQ